MLRVRIDINGRIIKEYTAKRIKGNDHEVCVYQLNNGALIKHHYDDGADELAIKTIINQPSQNKIIMDTKHGLFKIPTCPQCNDKMKFKGIEENQYACECEKCDIIDWFCVKCGMEKSICSCGGIK